MILASLVWYQIVHIVLIVLFVFGTAFSLYVVIETARRVYINTLTKKCPDSWGRVCSSTTDEEQLKMWDEGIAWGESQKEHIKEVSIQNDGLKLVGNFFDYGYKKTVIFLCGRCECLYYCYYYAKPYPLAGYNVLAIDPRAHGESDGEYTTAGIKESQDVIKWIELLRDSFNQEEIVLHCICVGGSAGTLALIDEKCPKMVSKIVFDGCFTTFKDCYLKHYKALKHPVFPVYYLIWPWFKHYTKCNANDAAPIKYIDKIGDIPVLFIYGKEDIYCCEENCNLLINKTKNVYNVVWFEKGRHSHLRFVNTDEYDKYVTEFVK